MFLQIQKRIINMIRNGDWSYTLASHFPGLLSHPPSSPRSCKSDCRTHLLQTHHQWPRIKFKFFPRSDPVTSPSLSPIVLFAPIPFTLFQTLQPPCRSYDTQVYAVSGPLDLLFPLPAASFLQISAWLLLYFRHVFTHISPSHWGLVSPPSPRYQPTHACMHALLSPFHAMTHILCILLIHFFCLFCLLLHAHYLPQYLAYSRCLTNIYWINEWLHVTASSKRSSQPCPVNNAHLPTYTTVTYQYLDYHICLLLDL